MTTTRKLIIAFWIFIGVMILWSFYSYNQSLSDDATAHPTQTTFIFLHTNAAPVAPKAVQSEKADVVQTAFVVQPSTPSAGSFTCLVTIKNLGRSKATDIQVCVRPYRGVSNFDEDVGHQAHTAPLPDDDPISQFNDWLSFPDLASGESSTRPISFTDRTDVKPGLNPNPQVVFATDKTTPVAPPTSPATPQTTPPPAAPQPHTRPDAN